jgi:DNA ligase 1
MKLEELVRASSAVAATSSRLEKISALATLLKRLSIDEIPIALGFLTGWPRQGKLGVGWAAVTAARGHEPSDMATLELRDVDAAFDQLTRIRGKASGIERSRALGDLFSRATIDEQRFLAALLVGEVRQGALEGVLLDAVARAAEVSSDRLRRAVMMAGDLGTVAHTVLSGDADAVLARYQLEIFRPVQPMLADSAPTIADAVIRGTPVAVEWKIDGARIQVHRRDDRIVVYTRNLNDVTSVVPEVIDAVRALPCHEVILDGEVIALMSSGRPHSFQDTMRRFGRRLDAAELRLELPLSVFFFDVLLHDGDSVLDLPLIERLDRLDHTIPPALRVPRIITDDVDEAARFQEDALARGHEGVMIKALGAPYAAGRRGSSWLKVKTARSLDLVVLAVEWGSGRRKGWLSNIHLGAREPTTGGFVMLGKTFKGMTDEMLAWQTKELLAREVRRDGHIVYVRPELVVEVAFNEVQRSTQYPGGVALRFARVKGYRPDKKAAEADTIDAVRAFLPPTEERNG